MGYSRVHDDCIKVVVITPDDKYLFTGSDDKTIKMWDISSRCLFHDFKAVHNDWIRKMAISSSGEFLLSVCEENNLKQLHLSQSNSKLTYFKMVNEIADNKISTICQK